MDWTNGTTRDRPADPPAWGSRSGDPGRRPPAEIIGRSDGGPAADTAVRWVAGLATARRPAYTFSSAHSVHSGMPTLRFGGTWSRGWRGLLILGQFPV